MIAFRRLRLPFLGLLLAALTGILLAAAVTWPSGIFLALCGIFLVAGVLPLRGPWILASVACAFACVQVWQTRESSSETLARILDSRTLLVEARGRVISDPTPSGTTRERFTMQIANLERDGRIMTISAPVVVVMPSPAPARGDEIRITGSLQTIQPPRNPGEFDAKAWMARNGISCRIDVASARDASITRPASRLSLVGLASQSRQWMEATLRMGIADAPVVCDFLAGMVLGVTREIPDSLQREFRNTGTFHLFSVGGRRDHSDAVFLRPDHRMETVQPARGGDGRDLPDRAHVLEVPGPAQLALRRSVSDPGRADERDLQPRLPALVSRRRSDSPAGWADSRFHPQALPPGSVCPAPTLVQVAKGDRRNR
jgi:hypothetical protein